MKPEISRRSRRIAVPCPYKEIDHDTRRSDAERAPAGRTGFRCAYLGVAQGQHCVDYRTDLAGGRGTALGEQVAHQPVQTAVSLTRPSPSGKAKVTPQYFGLGPKTVGWCYFTNASPILRSCGVEFPRSSACRRRLTAQSRAAVAPRQTASTRTAAAGRASRDSRYAVATPNTSASISRRIIALMKSRSFCHERNCGIHRTSRPLPARPCASGVCALCGGGRAGPI